MKNLEQIDREISELRNLLCNDVKATDDILKKLKKLSDMRADAKLHETLTSANFKYTRLRNMAKDVFNIENITDDVFCNDGSLHKTKAKKYPKLLALNYIYGKFKDGVLTEITYNGENFRMVKTKYEYNKPDVYTKIIDFNEFLEFNNIPVYDFTLSGVKEIQLKLNEARKEIVSAIEQYKSTLNKLNAHSLQYWGIAKQSNAHLSFIEI